MKLKTNSDPFRVLHIMSSFGGGISTFIMNLASEIQQYGIVFDVVTYHEVSEAFQAAIQGTGGDVYQLKNPKHSGWKAFKESYTRVLDLYPYDAIHCHITGYRAMVYKILSRPYGVKRFYVHAHFLLDEESKNPKVLLSNTLNRQINRYISDGRIGCSTLAIKSIFGYDTPLSQMMKIPNSINPQDFIMDTPTYGRLRREGRAILGFKEDALLFGQIGRLEPIKNHKKTLEIAAYMKAHQLPGHFLIVGDGKLKNAIIQEIQDRSLEAQVTFVGRKQPIAPFMPVLDCLIFPSFREGLGTVAIESQAAGVPVVISRSLPPEIDLNIGLIKRLSLHNGPDQWYEALCEGAAKPRLRQGQRLEAIQGNHYTNKEAARLYARYIGEQ